MPEPTYQPGDVVNGHRLSDDGTAWLPLPAQPVAPHLPPGSSAGGGWFARHKVMAAVGGAAAVVLMVAVGGGTSGGSAVGGAADAAATPAVEASVSEVEPATPEAEPATPEVERKDIDGMASGPSEEQVEAAGEFGSWVSSLHSTSMALSLDSMTLTMRVRLSAGSTIGQAADEVKDLADSYPVAGSSVPALLNSAAEAHDAALASYQARDLSGGESSAQLAASKMREARDALAADVARVEADCDCRLVTQGRSTSPISPAVTEELAEVVEWIDGDTVETTKGRVRLIGVDTPEMSDKCSLADDAKRRAEAIAPRGTEVTLVDPYAVDDKDGYGRLLRYVDVTESKWWSSETTVVDVGYSQILSGLAVARYDSQDGYQWHPRESDYRDASGTVGPEQLECLAPAPAFTVNGDNDDDGEHLLVFVAALFADQIAEAEGSASVAREEWAKRDAGDSYDTGGGSSGGGSSGGGSYCRGRFCVG